MAAFAPQQLADSIVQTSQTLLLDSQIRDWVVLPLLIIMICAGLLRSEVSRLLRPTSRPISVMDVRTRSVLARVGRLRGGAGGYLSSRCWEARRQAWSVGEVPQGGGGNLGWLREQARQAEANKNNLLDMQNEECAADANSEPLSLKIVPGMDPSIMMVILLLRIPVHSYFCFYRLSLILTSFVG